MKQNTDQELKALLQKSEADCVRSRRRVLQDVRILKTQQGRVIAWQETISALLPENSITKGIVRALSWTGLTQSNSDDTRRSHQNARSSYFRSTLTHTFLERIIPERFRKYIPPIEEVWETAKPYAVTLAVSFARFYLGRKIKALLPFGRGRKCSF